ELHGLALGAPPGQSLADMGQDWHAQLRQAIVEAQAIWFDTPIARYLDRSEGPVYLDHQAARTIPRVSGSCNHDLALALAVGVLCWFEKSLPASDYVPRMRFYTAAGDRVNEHLAGLFALVRCECQQGIARLRAKPTPALCGSNPAPEVPGRSSFVG